MSNIWKSHPDGGRLLEYVDGELHGRKARGVERHLDACPECRAEVEGLRTILADCLRYRQDVLEAHLPPPPEPWHDLYRDFARVDASLDAEFRPLRWLRRLGSTPARRWALTGAVAAVVACGVYFQLRQTPSVQAAALLNRAVAAAKAQPETSRIIRIRTRNRQFTRTVGTRRAPAAEASAPIQALFQAARYDWNDPLSAGAYKAWRDGVPAKQDEVATVADPQSSAGSCYRIRTVAASGELAAASLTLRATDLHPMESRLEFRNREWVELTEVSEGTARDDNPPVETSVEPPVGRPEPSRAATTLSRPTASISDELQVLSALHAIGADLGDPVDVSLNADKVVVSGVGIPPQRQRQIHDVLDAMPHVSVEFSEPGQTPTPAEPAVSDAASGGTVPAGIRQRLERQLGGQAEFQRFASQLLDRNESAMARAYALRKLAQRFPDAAEPAMAPVDRQTLRSMAREHASAMAAEVAAIGHVLTPVLTSAGGTAAQTQPAGSAAWQPAAEELLRRARRVEVLLSMLMGAAPGDIPAERLPSELLTALNSLGMQLDECRRLLAQ